MNWYILKAPFRLAPGLCGDCLATGHLLHTPASALPFHRGVPSECSHKLPTNKPSVHRSGLQGDSACDICQAGDGERATLIKIGLFQWSMQRSGELGGEHILVLCGETSNFPLNRNPILCSPDPQSQSARSCVLSRSVMSNSVTLWTVAHQAPLSMGFPRQESWSGLPFPSPGDLSDP